MKNKITLLTVLAIASLFLLACNQSGDEAQATPDDVLPPVLETSDTVSAEAYLIPIKDANIAFEVGGRVTDIMTTEGSDVAAGDMLVKLDDADAQAALAVAQAALTQAEASLAQAKAGPTTEQIGVAEAAVIQSQANLAQAAAGPTAEQIAAAEARVSTAKAQVDQVAAGSRPEVIEASLASVRQAENALKLAQADYDKVAYAPDGEFTQPIALALQDATLRYEAALANHQALLNGATSEEVAIAQAQVAEAQAALQQLLAGPTAEQIASAQAGVLQAEAGLAQAQAGPTTEQIGVAEAGVAQAAAAVEQAALALNKLHVSAPFAGTIIDLNTEIGEMVSPGEPVASIADFSEWKVETDDLTEIDVVKVTEGQSVIVQFDAIPGEDFAGTVTRIKPRSELKAGDVTYTVIIDLDNSDDPRLRWGMTAFVEIDVE